MKMTLIITASLLILSRITLGGIHEDIESCNVLNNPTCLKSILHRLAGQQNGGEISGTLKYSCYGVDVVLSDGTTRQLSYTSTECNKTLPTLNGNPKKLVISKFTGPIVFQILYPYDSVDFSINTCSLTINNDQINLNCPYGPYCSRGTPEICAGKVNDFNKQ